MKTKIETLLNNIKPKDSDRWIFKLIIIIIRYGHI